MEIQFSRDTSPLDVNVSSRHHESFRIVIRASHKVSRASMNSWIKNKMASPRSWMEHNVTRLWQSFFIVQSSGSKSISKFNLIWKMIYFSSRNNGSLRRMKLCFRHNESLSSKCHVNKIFDCLGKVSTSLLAAFVRELMEGLSLHNLGNSEGGCARKGERVNNDETVRRVENKEIIKCNHLHIKRNDVKLILDYYQSRIIAFGIF